MYLFKFLCSGIGFIAEEEGTWGQELWKGLRPVLIAFFALVAAAAIGYSIFLGFLLAKSEDAAKRKQAKSRITKTIFGLFVIIILVSVVLSGLIDDITEGTKDRVRFEVEEMNFSLTEVNGSPKQLIVRRDGAIVTDKVTFVKVSGIGTIHNGKSFSSTEAGVAAVNVQYEGKSVAHVLINVRSIGEPPPPKEITIIPGGTPDAAPAPTPSKPGSGSGTGAGNSGDTGVDIPPPTVKGDGTPLGDMRAWVESNLMGRSGYEQLKGATRYGHLNGSYSTHYMNGSTKVSLGAYYFDCSAFTQFIAGRFGRTNIAATASTQHGSTGTIFQKDPLPGDFYYTRNSEGKIGHVGIYLGGIGSVQQFGSFGNTINSAHTYLHIGGGFSNNPPKQREWVWSSGYGRYLKGVEYGTLIKQSNGTFRVGSGTKPVEFTRPIDFTNSSIRFSPYTLKP